MSDDIRQRIEGVLREHRYNYGLYECDCQVGDDMAPTMSAVEWDAHVADAVATELASRYAIVELPEPDSTRYEGEEFPPADRLAWIGAGPIAVSVWDYPEVQVAVDDEPLEPISIADARTLAAALLAAADAAERKQ